MCECMCAYIRYSTPTPPLSVEKLRSPTYLTFSRATGELTIFTGPTGSGKTTLMGKLSLDLSLQGVSVCVCGGGVNREGGCQCGWLE